MAIEFKDGKYVDPQTGRVTLDPTVYLSLKHNYEPTRRKETSRMPSTA